MKHIVIFRTSGSYIDCSAYNCQELGLAKALSARGFRVSLIMAGPVTSHFKIEYNGSDVSVFYLRYKSINQSLCVFEGWKKLLTSLSPDVIQIHEFGMYMSFLVSGWARCNAVRCVLVQGNYDTTQKPVFKQLERLFNLVYGKRVLGRVDAIGCKTFAAGDYVKRYCNKKVAFTPVGIDVSKFCDHHPSAGEFRHKYGLIGKKLLLYVGRMEPRRNPMFLLDVMKLLPEDFCLVLVGDGPLLGQVTNRVKSEHISNVRLLGKKKQEDLPSIYSDADLFLLASKYEIYGMVLLESMFFGCPALSTKTAGAETLINNGVDGVIIDGDLVASQWADTIRSLFEVQAEVKNMGELASKKIRECFVWNKVCENFLNIYDFGE